MKRILSAFIFILFVYTAYAQTVQSKTRGMLQIEVILTKVIKPQLAKRPLSISSQAEVDQFFKSIETAWASVAKDSLKAHPSALTLDEFSRLDAYGYLWSLTMITGNVSAGPTYLNKIVRQYMVPAMQYDYAILKRLKNPFAMSMIHIGNLGNTLSLGSMGEADRETVAAVYNLYNDFALLFNTLTKSEDAAVSAAAVEQLKAMEKSYYAIVALHAYYNADFDKAMSYVLEGITTNKYPKVRAIALSEKLINAFSKREETNKSIALLDALALNTTADNLNRDTLLNLYRRIDPQDGAALYSNILKKMHTSDFVSSGSKIKLPLNWSFVVNALPAEKIKKAKYIFVDFWYAGCVPCVSEIPDLNAFYSKLSKRDDVIFLSVNTDYMSKKDISYVKKASQTYSIRFPVVYDNEKLALAAQLKVTGYPAKYIIDINGNVLMKIDQSPMSLESFDTFIKELK